MKKLQEKFLPCMLHFLDPVKFREDNFMRVRYVKDRPKQHGGSDCGVYVCKYMDAILNGISLAEAAWDGVVDVITFRYRIAWELFTGVPRAISESGLIARNRGV